MGVKFKHFFCFIIVQKLIILVLFKFHIFELERRKNSFQINFHKSKTSVNQRFFRFPANSPKLPMEKYFDFDNCKWKPL